MPPRSPRGPRVRVAAAALAVAALAGACADGHEVVRSADAVPAPRPSPVTASTTTVADADGAPVTTDDDGSPRAVPVTAIGTTGSTGGTAGSGTPTTTGPGSTTTSPPVTAAAPIPTTGPIGYVGCSNTARTIGGSHAAGASRFWPEMNYGGGTIVGWNDDLDTGRKGFWGRFDQALAAQPTRLFWVQLCLYANQDTEDVYDSARVVIAEIRRRAPGATVYFSPMNGFADPHVCGLTGPDGEERMDAIADRVVRDGLALRGPDVGDLISAYDPRSAGATLLNNETESDGCHPNPAGERKLGRNLVAFPTFS